MRTALGPARAWLACPCDVHRRAGSAEDDEATETGGPLHGRLESIRWAIRPPAWGADNGLHDALRLLPRLRDDIPRAETRSIRDALVAWALQDADRPDPA